MKMIAGAFSRACTKRSRTRAAPTPTNISTNSEPLIEKNGTPASPATARASSVLPVPGGPTSSTPLGMRAPSRPYSAGFLRKSTISLQLVFGLVDARDVLERRLRIGFDIDLGLAAADRHQPADAALAFATRRNQKTHRPKNNSVGMTHDSNVLRNVFCTCPLNRT